MICGSFIILILTIVFYCKCRSAEKELDALWSKNNKKDRVKSEKEMEKELKDQKRKEKLQEL